ncbi:MAG: ATP-binding cassette domain-containing protein [Oscillospiraceae bacterium]|nr:ATP-binding cassette domain-containing protein [Oscillospiraceae bacterium]
MALTVDIEKQLGSFHLDVNFETDGELLALLGASGCGKSMTLKCIAGIETPDRGRIVLNGRTLFDREKKINLCPQKRHVGYLFQQYALFPNMTVLENIEAGLHRLPRGARAAAAREKLLTFRLEGMEQQRPWQLSGGQQQRVALARIFASEPELLLLDEPFAALDSYLRWQLELELADTLRQFGKDAVFVSHSRDEVYRLCQSVSVLSDGRSEPKKPVRTLFETPDTVSAALLSGCKNYSAASDAGDGLFCCADWGVTLRAAAPPPEGGCFVGVRAHYLTRAEGGEENRIPCRINRVVEDVFSTILMLETPGGSSGRSLLRMELPKERWRVMGEPDTLTVTVRPEDVMILTGAL